MTARDQIWHRGEDAAAEAYRRSGLEVIDRNYRCSSGEIDLILREGSTIVFSEVKARSSDRFGSPVLAVDARKQARLRRLAAAWLSERRPGRVNVRFDVVSVIVTPTRTEVSVVADAF
ncbi:MAG: YraN family protein [Actinobacteria bacterium]|jgi:putative endonuclease|nr:YraN family protein [Actinomycetota bacterium]